MTLCELPALIRAHFIRPLIDSVKIFFSLC